MSERELIAKIRGHFRRRDKTLFPVVAAMDVRVLSRPKNGGRYFSQLCREIIAQQLASKAASAIHGRFLDLFPRRRPTAERVLGLQEKKLRAIGMSWAKARYVRDLAEKTDKREVDLSGLHRMEDEAVVTELMKVKGIGRWTAEMFLIFTLGREDVFSFGDLGLRRGLERLYGKSKVATDEKVRAITNRWSPYRSYGSLALWYVKDENL